MRPYGLVFRWSRPYRHPPTWFRARRSDKRRARREGRREIERQRGES